MKTTCGYCNRDMETPLPFPKDMAMWNCLTCNAFMILSLKVSPDLGEHTDSPLYHPLDFLQLLPDLQNVIIKALFTDDHDIKNLISEINSVTLKFGGYFVTTAWQESELLTTAVISKILKVTVDRAAKIIKQNPFLQGMAERKEPSKTSYKRGRWLVSRYSLRIYLTSRLAPSNVRSAEVLQSDRSLPTRWTIKVKDEGGADVSHQFFISEQWLMRDVFEMSIKLKKKKALLSSIAFGGNGEIRITSNLASETIIDPVREKIDIRILA